ncbi:HNH endonuclease signature motif containing protein [Roseobacter litoralis]|uniref:HNH endonuclease signature motif containing protein n=1 Tax=Roseobacter litoralis TaxID=42443 RepID=UPI002490BAC9|nr:HNH endonuclease signature motif containing protein [Roseobacter litoralis]
MNRKPPAAIARQLRQEAGFGCAECGCPIIEYHHIVEWNEKKHFDPEHMVALCPNHHSQFGKLPRQRSYHAKKNPINLRNGRIYGFLGGNKQHKSIRIGSNVIENCRHVVRYGHLSLLSYRLLEGEYKLNVFIPNNDFWPEIKVEENALSAQIANFWDIEFKTNWLKFRRRQGESYLNIDFRGNHVEVSARLEILGEEILFSPKGMKYGGVSMDNGYFERANAALDLRTAIVVHPPNYAMRTPKRLIYNVF